MQFTWNDSYSVGIDLIDEQHKHFFGIANAAYEASENATVTPERLLAVVAELNDYGFYHLNTEEEYFKQFNYEDATLHTQIHNIFRNQMQKYLTEIRSGEGDHKALAKEIALYSGNWLGSHILVMDKQYAESFRAHGLK